MLKLTSEQILSVLDLSEKFPSTIWFTQVDNSGGRETVTVQGGRDVPQEDIEMCVKTVFPNATFKKYKTSDTGFDIVIKGQELGSIHLSYKEKAPTAMGAVEENCAENCAENREENREEIIQSNYTTECEVVANG